MRLSYSALLMVDTTLLHNESPGWLSVLRTAPVTTGFGGEWAGGCSEE